MRIPSTVLETIPTLSVPTVIAISGFNGAGKSTFAGLLGETIHAPIVGIDSFLDISSHASWKDMINFQRLTEEVLLPFRVGNESFSYGHFDSESRVITERISVHHHGVLILEGIWLFRKEWMSFFSFSLWLDCSLSLAVERGKKRDREVYHNPKDEEWEHFWKPNDAAYFAENRPDLLADVLIAVS